MNNNNKKKNTSRKIAIAIILIAIIGSLLGTASFIENRVRYAYASINPLFINYDFDTLDLQPNQTINIPSGVTTKINNNVDFKNIGWKNFTQGLETLSINNYTSDNINKNYILYNLYQPLSITGNEIDCFVTLNDAVNIDKPKQYICELELAVPLADPEFIALYKGDWLEYANFYFTNAPQSKNISANISLSYYDISESDRTNNTISTLGTNNVVFTTVKFTYYPGVNFTSSSIRIDFKFAETSEILDHFKFVAINRLAIYDPEGNDYFQLGYDNGLDIGREEGKKQAENIYKNEIENLQNQLNNVEQQIENAYNEGKVDGKDEGYQEGLETSTGLYSLVLGIFDAPINVFTKTFNFEILGVNLAGLVFGLLTLLIIVFIIRKFV